jgi:hypothetical protein
VLVGEARGLAFDVRLGEASDRLDAEAAAGANDTHGDLAAIGDEDAPDVVLDDWNHE